MDPHSYIPPPPFLNVQEQEWIPKAIPIIITPGPKYYSEPGWIEVLMDLKLIQLGEVPLFIKKTTKTVYFFKVYKSIALHEHIVALLSCVPLKEGSWNISFISFMTNLPVVIFITANCSWNQDLNGHLGSQIPIPFLEHDPIRSFPLALVFWELLQFKLFTNLDCLSTSSNWNPGNVSFL